MLFQSITYRLLCMKRWRNNSNCKGNYHQETTAQLSRLFVANQVSKNHVITPTATWKALITPPQIDIQKKPTTLQWFLQTCLVSQSGSLRLLVYICCLICPSLSQSGTPFPESEGNKKTVSESLNLYQRLWNTQKIWNEWVKTKGCWLTSSWN